MARTIYSHCYERAKRYPNLIDNGVFQKVGYIFDVSQTTSMNRNINEVKLWSFDKENDSEALKDMIDLQGYEASNILTENLYTLSRIYADESIYELANNLRITDEDKNAFVNFMRNSIAYAISSRFHIDYPFPMNGLRETFQSIDSIALMSVGTCISNACSQIIEETRSRARNFSKNRDLTKNPSADYNEINTTDVGGNDNVIRSDDERNGEPRNRVFGSGEYGRDRGNHQGEDLEQSGRREEIYGEISKSDLRSDETGVSFTETGRSELSNANRPLQREEASISPNGNTEKSDPLYEGRETETNESSEHHERGRSKVSGDDFSLERDDSQGSSRSVEENSIGKLQEEAENASFFYSKDNFDVLMTDEMLKRLPKLYKQEKVSLADKEVHAAYFIPFRSNWTWYMTEYDRESGDAFGLVLGFEPEWGYFNLNELKELNAQRLILEDFPKTFREIKDTELKKQMSEEELHSVFNGELSFEEDIVHEVKENELQEGYEEELAPDFAEEVSSIMEEYEISREEAISRLTTIKLEEALQGTNISIFNFSNEQLDEILSAIKEYDFYGNEITEIAAPELPAWKMEQLKWMIDDWNKGKDSVTAEKIQYLKNLEIDLAKFNVLKGYLVSDEVSIEQIESIKENINSVTMSEFVDSLKGLARESKHEPKAIQRNPFEYLSEEKEVATESTLDLSLGRMVYMENEAYTIRDVRKNEMLGKNDLWLDPVREGNHQMPIVSFADDKELLEKISFDKPKEKISNFKITEELFPEKLTPSERLNNNLEAISMLNSVEKGERELDSAAQETLAKYVGWGGLAEVFDEERGGQWETARKFLKENLSPEAER